MKIIKPTVTIPYIDGVSVMKNIERAGRTCYKSEVLSNDSYKKFIKSIITRGHESVLEHEKITVRLVTDRGTMWDITRHRHASFSIESSRYCNYSKDKFGNEIKVIEPFFLKPDVEVEDPVCWQPYLAWSTSVQEAEKSYFKILELATKPDYARMVLPASLATEIVMTANIREWRHILKLRCASTVHPHVRQVMIPILQHFKSIMPELFEDIPYDEEFAQKYNNDLAKVEIEASDIQLWAVNEYTEVGQEDISDGDNYSDGFSNGYRQARMDTLWEVIIKTYRDKGIMEVEL